MTIFRFDWIKSLVANIFNCHSNAEALKEAREDTEWWRQEAMSFQARYMDELGRANFLSSELEEMAEYHKLRAAPLANFYRLDTFVDEAADTYRIDTYRMTLELRPMRMHFEYVLAGGPPPPSFLLRKFAHDTAALWEKQICEKFVPHVKKGA